MKPTDMLKECATCKILLPPSAYYTDRRHKYVHCKACEGKRLTIYRDSRKMTTKQTGEMKECRACRKMMNSVKFATTGKAATLVCRPCAKRMLHHKDPHVAEIRPDGQCHLCRVYGKSAECIRQ